MGEDPRRDLLIALADVREDLQVAWQRLALDVLKARDRLADLIADAERSSLNVPVEKERGPDESEPLRPENPDEEAPIAADSSTEGRRPVEWTGYALFGVPVYVDADASPESATLFFRGERVWSTRLRYENVDVYARGREHARELGMLDEVEWRVADGVPEKLADAFGLDRRDRPPESLDFVINSRRPLIRGDRLRVFSNYRGELQRLRVRTVYANGVLALEPETWDEP